MLVRLRETWLTLATLLVVFVASWAGVAAGCSPRYDEDTIEVGSAGCTACKPLKRGGPSTMQEEDDETHADHLDAVSWGGLELSVGSWPDLVAQRPRRDLVGERPPYAGPLERPPHA